MGSERTERIRKRKKKMKNTKRKHLKLCLLLLFMVLGCFAITNVRTTTVSADDETSDIPGIIFEHFLGM